jgi:hypothetical protein
MKPDDLCDHWKIENSGNPTLATRTEGFPWRARGTKSLRSCQGFLTLAKRAGYGMGGVRGANGVQTAKKLNLVAVSWLFNEAKDHHQSSHFV